MQQNFLEGARKNIFLEKEYQAGNLSCSLKELHASTTIKCNFSHCSKFVSRFVLKTDARWKKRKQMPGERKEN